MKVDNILLVQTFFLPGHRHRLPKLFESFDTKDFVLAGKLIRKQKQEAEKLTNSALDVDMKTLMRFLLLHRKALLNRLSVMVLRSKTGV